MSNSSHGSFISEQSWKISQHLWLFHCYGFLKNHFSPHSTEKTKLFRAAAKVSCIILCLSYAKHANWIFIATLNLLESKEKKKSHNSLGIHIKSNYIGRGSHIETIKIPNQFGLCSVLCGSCQKQQQSKTIFKMICFFFTSPIL